MYGKRKRKEEMKKKTKDERRKHDTIKHNTNQPLEEKKDK